MFSFIQLLQVLGHAIILCFKKYLMFLRKQTPAVEAYFPVGHVIHSPFSSPKLESHLWQVKSFVHFMQWVEQSWI